MCHSFNKIITHTHTQSCTKKILLWRNDKLALGPHERERDGDGEQQKERQDDRGGWRIKEQWRWAPVISLSLPLALELCGRERKERLTVL